MSTAEPTDSGQETLGFGPDSTVGTQPLQRLACTYVCMYVCVCVCPCIHCISGQGEYANLKPNHFSHGKQPAGNTSGMESTTKRCQSQQRCLSYSYTIPLVSAIKIIGLEKATHHPTHCRMGLARPILGPSQSPGDQAGVSLDTFLPLSLRAQFQLEFLLNRFHCRVWVWEYAQDPHSRGTPGKFCPFSGHQLLDLNLAGLDHVIS